jgi:hypothetical protein
MDPLEMGDFLGPLYEGFDAVYFGTLQGVIRGENIFGTLLCIFCGLFWLIDGLYWGLMGLYEGLEALY